MWGDNQPLNFDNIQLKGLPVQAKKKEALARGGGGKIRGTRLELGIAGRKSYTPFTEWVLY